MTLLLDMPPETEAILRQEAQQRGLTVERYVVELVEDTILDREDAAEARQIKAATKPEEWRSLDDLRAAIRGNVQ